MLKWIFLIIKVSNISDPPMVQEDGSVQTDNFQEGLNPETGSYPPDNQVQTGSYPPDNQVQTGSVPDSVEQYNYPDNAAFNSVNDHYQAENTENNYGVDQYGNAVDQYGNTGDQYGNTGDQYGNTGDQYGNTGDQYGNAGDIGDSHESGENYASDPYSTMDSNQSNTGNNSYDNH